MGSGLHTMDNTRRETQVGTQAEMISDAVHYP